MWRVREYRDFRAVVCDGDRDTSPNWECPGENIYKLQAYLAQFLIMPLPSDVLAWIESQGLGCHDATTLGRRYVYMTVVGPTGWRSSQVKVSVEAAVEAYLQQRERWAASNFAPGEPLGYWGAGYAVESPQDALVVLPSTVSVVDGVVRGLAQNHSERLWARDVAVTATDPAGVEHTWRFPLAVQPGEPMPFEIEGWTGSQSPSEIALTVSADMSPRIDLTRSLKLNRQRYRRTIEELFDRYPGALVGSEIADGDDVHLVEVHISLEAPTVPTRLTAAALEQTIENFAVYAATFYDDAVHDVFELIPTEIIYFEGPEGIEHDRIETSSISGSAVGVILKNQQELFVWAGGTDA